MSKVTPITCAVYVKINNENGIKSVDFGQSCGKKISWLLFMAHGVSTY